MCKTHGSNGSAEVEDPVVDGEEHPDVVLELDASVPGTPTMGITCTGYLVGWQHGRTLTACVFVLHLQ